MLLKCLRDVSLLLCVYLPTCSPPQCTQCTQCTNSYQMAGDPISTLLPYTGDAMDRRLNSHTEVPASSVSFTNT